MPEGRPQHEVKKREGLLKDKPLYEESYRQHADALGQRKVPNSKYPMERLPERAGGMVLITRIDLVQNAQGMLDRLVGGTATGPADPWRQRAETCGADLAGYLNDSKLEFASKYGQPEWVKLMDFVEYADRDGGLAKWLDLWAEATRRPDYDVLAMVAEQVSRAVEFNQNLIKETLEKSTDANDVAVRAQGQELLSLMSSVAAEVSRQAGDILKRSGQPPVLRGRSEAVRDALRRMSEPLARAGRIRESVNGLQVAERFDADQALPAPSARTLKTALETWQKAAGELGRLQDPQASQPDDPEAVEVRCASHMLKGVNGVEMAIDAAMRDATTGGRDQELAHRDLRELLDSLHAYSSSTIDALSSEEAKQRLDDQRTKLASARDRLDQMLAGAYPLHQGALEAARRGKLDDFWAARRDELLRQVPDKALRTELEQVYKGGLGPKLDKWSKAQEADAYGLSWQLVATLRNYRNGTEAVLLKLGPAGAPLLEQATRLMDAMSAGVMQGLA